MRRFKAIIFDMDGVIIDSVALWKRAEKEVFTSVGVELSDELCEITESMTTLQVTNFWFERQPWTNKKLIDVENEVIERVGCLIEEEGTAIHGIEEIIHEIKCQGYKIGLATNSPSILIPVVLKKLQLETYFDAISSAEHEPEGKPNPSVYLTVARKLNVEPETCIVFEDSYSGLLAAKNAGMKTVAVLKDNYENVEYEIADMKIENYAQFDFSAINEVR